MYTKGFKDSFLKKLHNSSLLTKEEVQELDPIPESLDRSTGAKILDLIKQKPQKLYNNIDFAADSLFCEWAYMLDFVEDKFRIFKGFNTQPLTEKDFFFNLTPIKQDSYHPIKEIAWFPIPTYQSEIYPGVPTVSLPTEKEFLDIVNKAAGE